MAAAVHNPKPNPSKVFKTEAEADAYAAKLRKQGVAATVRYKETKTPTGYVDRWQVIYGEAASSLYESHQRNPNDPRWEWFPLSGGWSFGVRDISTGGKPLYVLGAKTPTGSVLPNNDHHESKTVALMEAEDWAESQMSSHKRNPRGTDMATATNPRYSKEELQSFIEADRLAEVASEAEVSQLVADAHAIGKTAENVYQELLEAEWALGDIGEPIEYGKLKQEAWHYSEEERDRIVAMQDRVGKLHRVHMDLKQGKRNPGRYVVEEPGVVVNQLVKVLLRHKLVDDSGARTIELAARRADLPLSLILHLLSSVGGYPVTGKQFADAYKREVANQYSPDEFRDLVSRRLDYTLRLESPIYFERDLEAIVADFAGGRQSNPVSGSQMTVAHAIRAAALAGAKAGDTSLFDTWLHQAGLSGRGTPLIAELRREFMRGATLSRPSRHGGRIWQDPPGVWHSSLEPASGFDSQAKAEAFERAWRQNPSSPRFVVYEDMGWWLNNFRWVIHDLKTGEDVRGQQYPQAGLRHGMARFQTEAAAQQVAGKLERLSGKGEVVMRNPIPLGKTKKLILAKEMYMIPVADRSGLKQLRKGDKVSVTWVSGIGMATAYHSFHDGMYQSAIQPQQVVDGLFKNWPKEWDVSQSNPGGNPGGYERYQVRFIRPDQANELVNLYHLARVPLSGTGKSGKYEQMLWASSVFSKEHPEVSSTAAYKDLDGLLSDWFEPGPSRRRGRHNPDIDESTRFQLIRALEREMHAEGTSDERALRIMDEIRALRKGKAKVRSPKKQRERYMDVLGGYVLDMEQHGKLIGFRGPDGEIIRRNNPESAAADLYTSADLAKVAPTYARVSHVHGHVYLRPRSNLKPLTQEREAALQEFASSYGFGVTRRSADESTIQPGYGFRLYRLEHKNNPQDEATDLYETFHGTPSDEEVTVIDEVHEHEHLTTLGRLAELKVNTISGFTWEKVWEGEGSDVPYLASTEDGLQLVIVGGDQTVDLGKIKMGEGSKWYRDKILVGDIKEVSYTTEKAFDGLRQTLYYHKAGEVTKKRPSLVYDTRNETLEVVGGQYFTTKRGIEN
jgi:hypothetical protein